MPWPQFPKSFHRRPEALLWLLVLGQSCGVTAVLPVLPLWAARSGASVRMVGLMVASYTAANLLALYPAGWLSDRLGRRPLMALGMIAYALASLGFLVWRDPWEMTALRAIEGIAGAAFLPAALAYAADQAPEHRQGSQVAALAVAQNAGILVGPMLGSLVATPFGLGAPFVVLAAIAALGALAVFVLPGGSGRSAPAEDRDDWSQVEVGAVVGVGSRTLAGGYATGMYESVWGLHMQGLGASLLQINLSWTLFALPAVVLGRWAGRAIDRLGPRGPAVVGTLFSAGVTATYGLTGNVNALIGLGMVDSVGYGFGYPAVNTVMVQAAPERLRGRVVGALSAVGTLGALLGALIVPIVYEKSVVACFGSAAVLLGGSALVMALVLPRTAVRAART